MTTEFTDVTVIMPAYRAASTIGRALSSIAAQTLKPRAVVVVDDGSDDSTTDAAEACRAGLDGIALTLLRQDNAGPGAARNRALTEAKTEYVAFLDADDEWFPTKLERTMAHMEGSDYVLVAHDYVTGEGAGQIHHQCALRFEEPGDPFHALYRKGYFPSCSVVARRDAVIAAGGFDQGLLNAQDFDLWLAMLKEQGTPFLVFGDALLRYHVTPGSIMSHTERRLRCGLEIAVRYFPDLKARPGVALMSLWFRVIALHREAVRAHGAKGELGRTLLTAGLLPVHILTTTLACFFAVPDARGTFLGQ